MGDPSGIEGGACGGEDGFPGRTTRRTGLRLGFLCVSVSFEKIEGGTRAVAAAAGDRGGVGVVLAADPLCFFLGVREPSFRDFPIELLGFEAPTPGVNSPGAAAANGAPFVPTPVTPGPNML